MKRYTCFHKRYIFFISNARYTKVHLLDMFLIFIYFSIDISLMIVSDIFYNEYNNIFLSDFEEMYLGPYHIFSNDTHIFTSFFGTQYSLLQYTVDLIKDFDLDNQLH